MVLQSRNKLAAITESHYTITESHYHDSYGSSVRNVWLKSLHKGQGRAKNQSLAFVWTFNSVQRLMAEDAAGDVPAAKRRCTAQMKVSHVFSSCVPLRDYSIVSRRFLSLEELGLLVKLSRTSWPLNPSLMKSGYFSAPKMVIYGTEQMQCFSSKVFVSLSTFVVIWNKLEQYLTTTNQHM